MFTGIVAGNFQVSDVEQRDEILAYGVALPDSLREGLEIGASVSVDGVCQTVVKIEGSNVFFEAIPETCRVTTLETLALGQKVNIERSLTLGTELGGHQLSGHVMTTGRVTQVTPLGEACDFEISFDDKYENFVFEKGFIAMNGVSLTVGKLTLQGCTLHLIPETLKITNLSQLKEGDLVNLEFDQQTVTIVQTVERYLSKQSSS